MKWTPYVILSFVFVIVAPYAYGQCEAPDEWFVNAGTPPVSADFKVNDENEECDFYKWGWQTFLSITQSDQNVTMPRFVTFKNSNDLFDHPSGGKRQLFAAPSVAANPKHLLSLSVRTSGATGKGDISAIAFEQAGSQGVVIDQNHRALYYGIHLNDRFVKFIHDDLHLSNPAMIKDIDKTIEFVPGSLELKSAWRIVSDEELKPENFAKLNESFFVTKAVVPSLIVENGKIKADPNRPREETVALVGLHVVGTIVNHPEFIWASFEHIGNSPVLKDQMLPSNQPVDAIHDYTFYRKGTEHGKSNKNPVLSTTNPLKLVDETKQTLDPIVDLFRQFNSGEGGVGEDEDLITLNPSVKRKLPESLKVWRNYQMIGAVWIKEPGSFKEETKLDGDSILAGEKKLSNSVMETFTQLQQVNCFSCHDTQEETDFGKTLPGLRLKVSHVIRNAFLTP